MFSGIVEAMGRTLKVHPGSDSLQIVIEKPNQFDDLKIGDSIACNGVCLTVEAFDSSQMSFTIGWETLKLIGWTEQSMTQMNWNLERSLKLGDRIHGHLVSGHADGIGEITLSQAQGDCWLLSVAIPQALQKSVWKKSSIAINGVSLTVNNFVDNIVEVCLVPETLRKTNLSALRVGDNVTVETDYYMKGLLAHAQADRTY